MTGPSPDDESEIPFADSPILTYAIPFVGSLLIAVGIAAGVVGGYAPVQERYGLCGPPTISVSSAEATDRLLEGPGTDAEVSFRRIAFADLSSAEQHAIEAALSSPLGETEVEGSFPHRRAFENGALVRYRGQTHYVTVTETGQCVAASPLLFPLGVVSILLGIVWILAPPMYRRLAALERGATG